MLRSVQVGIASVAILVLCVAGVHAKGKQSVGRMDGGALYRDFCASCHGLDARGTGPDAEIFSAPPRNLREGFLKLYKAEDLVRRVRDGKPLELALDLKALQAHAVDVEAVVGYLRHLPEIRWDVVDAGGNLYLTRCILCHGMYGRPGSHLPAGVKAPRDLSDPDFQRSISDQDLVVLVGHGRKEMPALTPHITDAQAAVLVRFVRVLSPGFELYSRYCESCHGVDGRGAGSLAEELRAPTVVFDRAYLAHHDAEQLRATAWHMVREEKPHMPHYRSTLTQAQARAIVKYLQQTE